MKGARLSVGGGRGRAFRASPTSRDASGRRRRRGLRSRAREARRAASERLADSRGRLCPPSPWPQRTGTTSASPATASPSSARPRAPRTGPPRRGHRRGCGRSTSGRSCGAAPRRAAAYELPQHAPPPAPPSFARGPRPAAGFSRVRKSTASLTLGWAALGSRSGRASSRSSPSGKARNSGRSSGIRPPRWVGPRPALRPALLRPTTPRQSHPARRLRWVRGAAACPPRERRGSIQSPRTSPARQSRSPHVRHAIAAFSPTIPPLYTTQPPLIRVGGSL